MNATQNKEGEKFQVRYAGHAVKFHTNLCGDVYNLVADAEATQFDSKIEATGRAVRHNLPMRHATIVPVEK